MARFSLEDVQSDNMREAAERKSHEISRRSSSSEEPGFRSAWAQHGVKLLREGEAFGEKGLLQPGAPAAATLKATADNASGQCKLYMLPYGAFQELCVEIPDLRMAVEDSHTHSALLLCLFLANADLFKNTFSFDLPLDLLPEIAGRLKPMACKDGQALIKKGQPAVGLFIVRTGEAHCFIDDPTSSSGYKLVKKICAGGLCGELSLLEPHRETAAHVHAAGATEVLLLTPVKYEELCARFADFRQLLLSSTMGYASFNFFLNCNLLKGSSHELVQAISKVAKLEMHVSGSVLVKPSEVVRTVYFVQRGKLSKAFSTDDNDLVELGAGDHCGLRSVEGATAVSDFSTETGAEAPATDGDTEVAEYIKLTTVCDSLLFAISIEDFKAVMRDHPELVQRMTDYESDEKKRSVETMHARMSMSVSASPSPSFAKRRSTTSSELVTKCAIASAHVEVDRSDTSGLVMSAHVDTQLAQLQQAVQDMGARLELEVNRCRAAQERQESRVQDMTDRLLSELRSLKGPGQTGPTRMDMRRGSNHAITAAQLSRPHTMEHQNLPT